MKFDRPAATALERQRKIISCGLGVGATIVRLVESVQDRPVKNREITEQYLLQYLDLRPKTKAENRRSLSS